MRRRILQNTPLSQVDATLAFHASHRPLRPPACFLVSHIELATNLLAAWTLASCRQLHTPEPSREIHGADSHIPRIAAPEMARFIAATQRDW